MTTDADEILARQVVHQLGAIYLPELFNAETIRGVLPQAATSTRSCFTRLALKYYVDPDRIDPLHGAHWAIFLYYLSRAIAEHGEVPTADAVYGLNRTLHGVDLFHQVALPPVFLLDHPVGSVMGRASYASFFAFGQGCTVGNNRGAFPRFGQYVRLFAGASVIGNCTIGDHVVFAANSSVIDMDVPSSSIVFGQAPNCTIKRLSDPSRYFDIFR